MEEHGYGLNIISTTGKVVEILGIIFGGGIIPLIPKSISSFN